jgi:hypothetical protein
MAIVVGDFLCTHEADIVFLTWDYLDVLSFSSSRGIVGMTSAAYGEKGYVCPFVSLVVTVQLPLHMGVSYLSFFLWVLG